MQANGEGGDGSAPLKDEVLPDFTAGMDWSAHSDIVSNTLSAAAETLAEPKIASCDPVEPAGTDVVFEGVGVKGGVEGGDDLAAACDGNNREEVLLGLTAAPPSGMGQSDSKVAVESMALDAGISSGDVKAEEDVAVAMDSTVPMEVDQNFKPEEKEVLVATDGAPVADTNGGHDLPVPPEKKEGNGAVEQPDAGEKEVLAATDGAPIADTNGGHDVPVSQEKEEGNGTVEQPDAGEKEVVVAADGAPIADTNGGHDVPVPLEKVEGKGSVEQPVAGMISDDVDGGNNSVAEEDGTNTSMVEEAHPSEFSGEVPGSTIGTPVAVIDTPIGGVHAVHSSEEQTLKKKEKETADLAEMTSGNSVADGEPPARYTLTPQEDKASFAVSDLIWGKVKSHPWWPGEIFDASRASDKALKHQRDGKFLVAYFGDNSFAWNDEGSMKPFYSNFSSMEKQSKILAFDAAIDDALSEAKRRMTLGMTCRCYQDKFFAGLKQQKVEHAGLRERTSRHSVDRAVLLNSFRPVGILDFLKELAKCPSEGANRLELITAEAQLKSFYRSKGYRDLPTFLYFDRLEDDSGVPPSEKDSDNQPALVSESSPGKRPRSRSLSKEKYAPEVGRKRKRVSDVVEKEGSESGRGGGTKGKSRSRSSKKKHEVDEFESPDTGKGKRRRLGSVNNLDAKTPSPRSAKVGERMRRIARQMTESSPILKSVDVSRGASTAGRKGGGVDGTAYDNAGASTVEKAEAKVYSSPSEALLQLYLVAQDPSKKYSFLPESVSYFTDFRALVVSSLPEECLEIAGGKRSRRKSGGSKSSSGGIVPPGNVQDSYWSDVVLHIGHTGEEELATAGRKRRGRPPSQGREKKMKPAGDDLPVPLPSNSLPDAAVPQVVSVVPDATHDMEVDAADPCVTPMPSGTVGKIEDISPTSLILSFTDSDTLPSVSGLIDIFRRFGPLEEAETEVLKELNRAKVVFRRRVDAETALNSAGKNCFFGTALVSYRLRSLSPTPKTSPDDKQEKKGTLPNESGDSKLPENPVVSDNAKGEAGGN